MATTGIYNFPAQMAHRHLRKTNVKLSLAMAQLSAGRRVQAAKDDAAALALGSRFGAEIAGLHQAHANAGQAAAMLQVADGGMARIGDMLVRMKALAVQAGSGQLSATERGALDSEFQALSAEIGRIAADTDFAGTPLLDGSAGSIDFKVGTGTGPAADELSVPLADVSAAALSLDTAGIASRDAAEAALAAVDGAIGLVQHARAGIGASQNRLDAAAAGIATSIENTEAARSALIDLDIAAASADLAALDIRNSAGIAMLNQANRQQKAVLRLVV